MKTLSGMKLQFYLLMVALIISCSNNGSEEQPVQEQEGIVDPALVGTWSGTFDGDLGEANINIELKSDGTMSAEAEEEDSRYCPLNGKWEVKNETFKATGNDECDGTFITLTAAAYSKTRLEGHWNASSGNNGTFDISKQ